jgi:hypothetical protein
MLWRSGKQVDDEPGWREKVAEWRDSPPWVFERPEWMTESPGVLALLFAGILAAMLGFVYLVLPPTALPAELPGHWQPPAAPVNAAATTTTAAPTSTTTTTLSLTARLARNRDVKTWSEKRKADYWKWIAAVAENERRDAAEEALLRQPPKPPFRRFDYAVFCTAFAGALLAAAWFLSEARARLSWEV